MMDAGGSLCPSGGHVYTLLRVGGAGPRVWPRAGAAGSKLRVSEAESAEWPGSGTRPATVLCTTAA